MSDQPHAIEIDELKNVAAHPNDGDRPSMPLAMIDEDADLVHTIRVHLARIRGNLSAYFIQTFASLFLKIAILFVRSRSNTPPRRHSRSPPPRKHSPERERERDRRSRSRSGSYSTSR